MTSAADLLRRLSEHRRWVTKRLLAAAASLDKGQLHREFPIGQGSVWRTLTHLWAAEFNWLSTVAGDGHGRPPGDDPTKPPGNQEGEGAARTIGELAARWAKLIGQWDAYLTDLDDQTLDEPVTRYTAAGEAITMSRLDTLLHVYTHAQYHTAQLVNMLRQLGVTDLPETTVRAFASERQTIEAR